VNPVFALVATGGTGGHTYPALALAEELVARGHERASIRFVGGRRGLEGRVVPDAGFAIDVLPGRGLQRRATPENLRALGEATVALVRALRLVRRHRPRVVVGFGGYASLPAVVAARLMRRPTVVHEQDAAPGLANRIAVRLGARAAVSLPGTPLGGAAVTGNPVRAAFASLVRDPDLSPRLVAVFGGSLGARTINDAALDLYDRWRARTDVSVHHVSGRRAHDDCVRRLAAARAPGDALAYELVAYEDRMERVFARASAAVCRAGAGTVAELAAAGLPAVLVPLPGAPSDHQAANARTLAAAGAAVLVDDRACTGERLDAELSLLLAEPSRLAAMGDAARSLARPDAAARLADLVEEHARGR
jgi:undecaprenyldiphospho-muramoylpentapeptide beta-N-acetylglucosaminyltransferase